MPMFAHALCWYQHIRTMSAAYNGSQACLEQRSVWWWQTLVDGLPVCQE